MTSTMYIPVRNVSDAANSANNEHNTFGQFRAGEVDVRVIVNAYLYAKSGTNSPELRAKFARSSREFVPDSHSQVSRQTQANGTIPIGHETATMATHCMIKGWFFLAGTCILFF